MTKIRKYKFGEYTPYYLIQLIVYTFTIVFLLFIVRFIDNLNSFIGTLWILILFGNCSFWFINIGEIFESFKVYEIDAKEIK